MEQKPESEQENNEQASGMEPAGEKENDQKDNKEGQPEEAEQGKGDSEQQTEAGEQQKDEAPKKEEEPKKQLSAEEALEFALKETFKEMEADYPTANTAVLKVLANMRDEHLKAQAPNKG